MEGMQGTSMGQMGKRQTHAQKEHLRKHDTPSANNFVRAGAAPLSLTTNFLTLGPLPGIC